MFFKTFYFIGKNVFSFFKEMQGKEAELKVLIMTFRGYGNLIHIFIQRLHSLVNMSQSYFSLSRTDNLFDIMDN